MKTAQQIIDYIRAEQRRVREVYTTSPPDASPMERRLREIEMQEHLDRLQAIIDYAESDNGR